MKKLMLWFCFAVLYVASVAAFYLALPPVHQTEASVSLMPARYLDIREDPATKSRYALVVLLPDYESAKLELKTRYLECAQRNDSTFRVMAAGSEDPKIYRFVIQDSAGAISSEHIGCAIDQLASSQGELWDLLTSQRRAVPPAGFENNQVKLIELQDQTHSGMKKALTRACVLGLVFVVVVYYLMLIYRRYRRTGSLG
jgi:hypothetical protein